MNTKIPTAAVILGATVTIAFLLNQLDEIVHGQLYNYDLRFDYAWAVPYWNFLRIVYLLLGVVAASTVVDLAYSLKKNRSSKHPIGKAVIAQKPRIGGPVPSRSTERPLAPRPPSPTGTASSNPVQMSKQRVSTVAPQAAQSTPTARPAMPMPESSQVPSETSGLIRCTHCGKVFTQPLRMLDFAGDRPRIVNICPFCSESIPSTPPRDDQPQKGFLFKKKNNNHGARGMTAQPTS